MAAKFPFYVSVQSFWEKHTLWKIFVGLTFFGPFGEQVSTPCQKTLGQVIKIFSWTFFSAVEHKKFLLLAKNLQQFIQNCILRVRRIILSKTFGFKIFFYHFPTISAKIFCWTVLGGFFKTGLSTAKRIFWVRIGFRMYFISILSEHWAESYRLSDIYFAAKLSKVFSTCPRERKVFVLKHYFFIIFRPWAGSFPAFEERFLQFFQKCTFDG